MSAVPPAGTAMGRVLDAVPHAAHLGLVVEVDDAGIVVRLPGSAQHVGDATRGSVHGGVLAALLELAAWAHLRALDPGSVPEAVDFTTVFVREALVRDTWARAHVVRRGRRFVHVRVDAWQLDPSDPVAAGQGTFALR